MNRERNNTAAVYMALCGLFDITLIVLKLTGGPQGELAVGTGSDLDPDRHHPRHHRDRARGRTGQRANEGRRP